MRRSKAGWKQSDLDRLYIGFGFDRVQGAKHTLYAHPEYGDLRTTVTRSRELPIGYIVEAIRLIDQARRREEADGN